MRPLELGLDRDIKIANAATVLGTINLCKCSAHNFLQTGSFNCIPKWDGCLCTSYTLNFIPKRDGSWGHISPTAGQSVGPVLLTTMLVKLRKSTMMILLKISATHRQFGRNLTFVRSCGHGSVQTIRGLLACKQKVGDAISVKTLVRWTPGLPDLLRRPWLNCSHSEYWSWML